MNKRSGYELSSNDEDTYDNPLCCTEEICQCPICLENKKLEKLSPCKHYVCKNCIETIIRNRPDNPLCPNCRTRIVSYGCDVQTTIARTAVGNRLIPIIATYVRNNIGNLDIIRDVDPEAIEDSPVDYFIQVISETEPLNYYSNNENVIESIENIFYSKDDQFGEIVERIQDDDNPQREYKTLRLEILNELIDYVSNSRDIDPRHYMEIYATIYASLDIWYRTIYNNNTRDGKKIKKTYKKNK